jgi:hypothetical protein
MWNPAMNWIAQAPEFLTSAQRTNTSVSVQLSEAAMQHGLEAVPCVSRQVFGSVIWV